MDFSWHHTAAAHTCMHGLAAIGRKAEQTNDTIREVGPSEKIAKIINAVRETLFLFTTLMRRHQGRSRKG